MAIPNFPWTGGQGEVLADAIFRPLGINLFDSPGFAALIREANGDCKARGMIEVDTEAALFTPI